MSSKRKGLIFEANITGFSHEGRGVAQHAGKVVFIDGALMGERIKARLTRLHRRFDEAEVLEVIEPSPERVEPRCAHFGVCGGCTLQHMRDTAQIHAKQGVVLDNLRQLGKVEPKHILPPLTGPLWGYRRRARLGVKWVAKKGKVLVGFRERGSPYLAELARCEVLDPSVGERLQELATLITDMEAKERIPQIEVAVGDNAIALVFRHMDPLSAGDRERLIDYARATGLHLFLQPAGPDSVHRLWPEEGELYYAHPTHHVRIDFLPVDFIQINGELNRKMVDLALDLLDLQPEERVLDLFAGLGNFTLPMARRVAEVVGVEGDVAMVRRGEESARRNGIDNTRHFVGNLFEPDPALPWMKEHYDKILLDPPRAGAMEIMPLLAKMRPKRIVYVSCNPATLARDAGILVNEHGYRLKTAGVMDMFPHTAHVESIAVFEPK
ncbi:MAG: 23S rRNA (uracil(1939)-C(5))-methyltransferase RlmD [Gammaproteobacteria bacterium]|nr:23S rRNA (uracil(1939)-C(5))-methyltransferase RlmD [Gammaproteobacteria bacterium]